LNGLSQKKFAAQLGFDQSTLSSWERKEFQLNGMQLEKLTAFLTSFKLQLIPQVFTQDPDPLGRNIFPGKLTLCLDHY
jgi:transcriptional regulator with XRE-family HTH domain